MSDYDGMTNADVMSYAEMAEYERDAEYALDAADEKHAAAEERARQAEPDLTPGDECHAEFIDGSYTSCGCEECQQREADETEFDGDAG